MARMNSTKANTLKKDTRTKLNHEGAVVHSLTALETLYSKVLGSFFGESTFYEARNSEDAYLELTSLINDVPYEDIEYVLKIAMIGRAHNMIQYPLAVLTACFNDERFKGEDFLDLKGRNKLQFYSDHIVKRGRDIVDIMATQITAYGFDKINVKRSSHRDMPLPMQLRKALKYKLESFNEYQLSKALSETREVSLADCIKLLRPSERRSKVSKNFFSKVIEGKVNIGAGSKQVQSELSKYKNSNSNSTVNDVAKSLDTSTVMAIVKNLVALYRTGVYNNPRALETIVSKLTDKKQILGSRLLPFRFYSAWLEINKLPTSKNVRVISDALITALDLSIGNLPKIQGYNAILIDRSGSMDNPVSSMSSVSAEDIALILGAICFKQGVGEVFLFGSSCKHLSNLSAKSTVIDLVQQFKQVSVGRGTEIHLALQQVKDTALKGDKFDNVILLSDNDCYTHVGSHLNIKSGYSSSNLADSTLNHLIKENLIGKFYVNNLLGNDFAIVNTEDYRKNLITGFSEKIVDMINMYSVLGREASDIRNVIDLMVGKLR